MDLTKFNDEDYKHIKAGNIQGLSDAGYQEFKNQSQHQSQVVNQAQNPQTAQDAAGSAATNGNKYLSPGESVQNNFWTNVKARISDPNRAKAILGMGGPAKENVVGNDMGAASLAMPMESAPAGLAKMAQYLGKGGLGPTMASVAANAGLGAANSAANGGDPMRGAAIGGALGAGGSAFGGLMKYFGKGAQAAGGTLANMSPEETAAYTKNPQMAEDVYNSATKTPDEFQNDMYGKLKNSADTLQKNYIDPRMAEISRGGVGKTYQVNPGQFEGTEAGNELKRQWANQGKKLDVPTFEPYKAEATPVQSELRLIDQGSQKLVTANNPYGSAEVQVTTPTSKIVKTGVPQIESEGLLNRGTQQVPAPMPDSMSIGTQPLLAAKRASSKAASLIGGRNPNNVSVPDLAQAQKESEASVALAKALHSQDPITGDLDQQVSEAIRNKNAALESGNPTKVLAHGSAMSGVPDRALADYLDQNTGSNFKDISDAFTAGKAMNDPQRMHGWSDRLFAVPVGRAAVKAAPKITGAGKAVQQATPVLNSLFSKE